MKTKREYRDVLCAEDVTALGRVEDFLQKLPVPPDEFEIELEAIETFADIEHADRKLQVQLEGQRDEKAARLRLLTLITWTVVGVVAADMALATAIVGASIFLDYRTDSWVLRILLTGPAMSVVGMLMIIVQHYWRTGRKLNAVKKPKRISSAPAEPL